MDMLVVYYSRKGNNEILAQYISEQYKADIERIAERGRRDGPFGVIKSVMGALAKTHSSILATKKDPMNYRQTIICTPAWAGHMPSPTRTYLHNNKKSFNKVAIISLCMIGKNEALEAEAKEILGEKFAGILELKLPSTGLEPKDRMNWVIPREDIAQYSKQITGFLDVLGLDLK